MNSHASQGKERKNKKKEKVFRTRQTRLRTIQLNLIAQALEVATLQHHCRNLVEILPSLCMGMELPNWC
jgi:hypothetical protein